MSDVKVEVVGPRCWLACDGMERGETPFGELRVHTGRGGGVVIPTLGCPSDDLIKRAPLLAKMNESRPRFNAD